MEIEKEDVENTGCIGSLVPETGQSHSSNGELENPHLVDGKYSIRDLIDIEKLRETLEKFSLATGFTTGFLEYPSQEILIATGWRDICTKFHRIVPESVKHCRESNIYLTKQLKDLNELNVCPCENGLVDGATPVIIKGKYIAYLSTGQILFKEPDIERFKKQAEMYGYDSEAYLKALKEVPVVTENQFKHTLSFLSDLAVTIAETGLSNLELKEKTRALGKEVAERKRTEKALQESENLYRLLADNVTDIIWTMDMNLRLTYVSPSIMHHTGYTVEESKTKTLQDFLTDSSHELAGKNLEKALEVEKSKHRDLLSYRTAEFEIKCKDDSVIWAETKMTFLRDKLGNARGIIGIARNITDRKHLENQLQQSQKMEAIGTLAGGIAHDFNNILFPILGYTDLLLQDIPENNPAHSKLKKIYISAIRAKDLVKQILIFSRQDHFELEPLELQPIIKETLRFIRSTIPTTITIKQDICSNCGSVNADPTQINQILMNLTTNAYHAMAENGGEIRVSFKKRELSQNDVAHLNIPSGNYACLTVADSGVGMDKNLTEKIFNPFFTTKEKGKGTGMGLSVVHGIVLSMNGGIQVYSKPGQGTEFNLFFPVDKKSFSNPDRQAPELIKGGNEKILLVDDEKDIVTMEKNMLTRLGYQVTTRAGSVEAIECFRAGPNNFDLVITDMAMPDMSGEKLAVELMKIRPDIPILLCTGFSQTMTEEKALSLGIKGFLMKPIEMKDLSKMIRKAINTEKDPDKE